MIKKENGFGLIELLVSISVFSVFAGTLVGAFILSREGVVAAGNRNRAAFLAEEGLEAARNIRDDSFNLLTNGSHGVARSGGVWEFVGTEDVTDGFFRRRVTISDAPVLGKLVIATVEWNQSQSRIGSVSVSMVLTNWQADWSEPPTSNPGPGLTGGQDAYKIKALNGYSFLIRDSSGTINFVAVRHSDNAFFSISLDNIKRYQNLEVLGNYAYVTGQNGPELKIVDISNPPALSPSSVTPFNLPGNEDATGIAARGSRLYIVREKAGGPSPGKFLTLDISTPTSPSVLSETDLPIEANNNENDICLLGSYAYTGVNYPSGELQIIDISSDTPPAPTGYDLPGTTRNPQSLACFGTTLIVGMGDGEVYFLDVNNPLSPSIITSIDATPSNSAGVNDMDLGLQNTLLFAGTSQAISEIKIIDISTLTSPSIIGSFNAPDVVFGVDFYPPNGCLYVVGQDNFEEYFNLCPN